MNDLCDIGYDQGNGFKVTFLSRGFPMGNRMSFNWGLRMDFAAMDHRDFQAVEINTPVPDMGDIQVRNSMYGFFGLGRFNFGTGRLSPFAEVLVGHRNLNTRQIITAQNPDLNPEYEPSTTYDKVVFTKRFHYGGSLGIQYKIGSSFFLESSVTYTEGGTGFAMPLMDVSQNEAMMNYPYSRTETDMLLINVGIRFRLGSGKASGSVSDSKSGPPTKTNTRYKDKKDSGSSSSGDSSDSSGDSNPPKKKLEVKPSTKPKKSDSGKS
jgi:hypothetical protein